MKEVRNYGNPEPDIERALRTEHQIPGDFPDQQKRLQGTRLPGDVKVFLFDHILSS